MYLNIIYATHLQILNLSACFFAAVQPEKEKEESLSGFRQKGIIKVI